MQWLKNTDEFCIQADGAAEQRYPTLAEKSKAFCSLVIADSELFSESADKSYKAFIDHQKQYWLLFRQYAAYPGPHTLQDLENSECP